MKRLVALTLVTGLACAITAGAAEPTPQARLTDALLCKGKPLDTVRGMTASGSSHFDRGFAAATFGEEMDEIGVVILKTPLEIAGAKTSAIVMTFAQSEDFGALVYGRFQGDYRKAVSALKLAPTTKKDGLRLGHFTRAMKSQPGEVCQMTIALTPLENGTFCWDVPGATVELDQRRHHHHLDTLLVDLLGSHPRRR